MGEIQERGLAWSRLLRSNENLEDRLVVGKSARHLITYLLKTIQKGCNFWVINQRQKGEYWEQDDNIVRKVITGVGEKNCECLQAQGIARVRHGV